MDMAELNGALIGCGFFAVNQMHGWKDVDGEALLLPHPALHAWKLSVDHPETGVRIHAEAPIPEAFRALAASLGLPGY